MNHPHCFARRKISNDPHTSFIASDLLLGIASTQAKDPTPNKILLSSHIGSATIISLSGVDSEEAIVRFQRKLDDTIEDCARSFGNDDNGDFDSAKIASCATREIETQANKIYTRRAVCPRNTLYTEFGNYSLIDWVKESDQEIGGHTWHPFAPPGRTTGMIRSSVTVAAAIRLSWSTPTAKSPVRLTSRLLCVVGIH